MHKIDWEEKRIAINKINFQVDMFFILCGNRDVFIHIKLILIQEYPRERIINFHSKVTSFMKGSVKC